jgi:peptidyl-prolyl cis-trans isomerase C
MRTTARVRVLVALCVAAACTVGCAGKDDLTPTEGAVATLDGDPIAVAELERYLEGILSFPDDAEPLEGEELDRVESRLFDAFIEEEILLREAMRRGVKISDAEIDAYLGVPESDEGASAPAREAARRNLMIQKLRGAVVGVDAEASPGEVEAYLEEHRDALEADRKIVLRSLMVGTEANANRVRREILRGEMAFAEAVEVFGLTPDQGQPMEVSLADLPEEIREALSGLETGEISKPVQFQGNVYLFMVDVGPAAVGEERLRALAVNELLRLKSQEASDRFLGRLRSQVAVEIHYENLPFTYIPE